MEEIMRFTIQADSTTFSPHGPWVRYEAHAKTIAELRAEVERLKARCLIEEWIAHEDAGSMMSLTVQQHAMVFDAIIAARAASTKGEDNAGTK